MDVQLKTLIEKIKNEGVKTAEENANRIIVHAKSEAESIINNAKQEAKRLKEVAEVDTQRYERSAHESLRQAVRDLLLSVHRSLEGIFNKIIKLHVSKTMDRDLMQKAVLVAIKNISIGASDGVVVQVPEKEFESVEAGLQSALASEIKQGAKIVPQEGLDAGFRISIQEGSVFYDFSDKQIAELISQYLNPRLAKYFSGE